MLNCINVYITADVGQLYEACDQQSFDNSKIKEGRNKNNLWPGEDIINAFNTKRAQIKQNKAKDDQASPLLQRPQYRNIKSARIISEG